MKKLETKTKKKIILIICLTLVFACGVAFRVHYSYRLGLSNEDQKYYGQNKNAAPVRLVAHRGYSDKAPENTVAAFELAGQTDEFWGIECDVQLTKDDKWVVMHDTKLDRTTNGSGKLQNYTLSQLKTFRINTGSNIKDYQNEEIPTIEEYLDVCVKYNKRPFIEIKIAADKAQVQSLYDIIASYGLTDSCTVISFYYDSLQYLRVIDSSIEIYALTNELDDATLKICKEHNFGIDFNENEIKNTAKLINKYAMNEIPLAAWTVKSQAEVDRMLDNGVNILTCNNPDYEINKE